MTTTKYLHRINYLESPSIDLSTLIKLHKCHVFKIPFENLDVQNKTGIKLEQNHLFKKVIENSRGGFCYELNYLFSILLMELGFNTKMISARIFDEGALGPEFDHMALIINLNEKNWLADVGFGDLFTKPLEIDIEDAQFDGRNYFKIESQGEGDFLLSMSKNGVDYEKKYLFKTDGKAIEDFSEQCAFKQYSDLSYFVKNKVVTIPTENGRKTIFNSKYIFKDHATKTEFNIITEKEERHILKKEFKVIQFKNFLKRKYLCEKGKC